MESVSINLALQGGGAHGAFTWGVLDRLLDESWISFEGVSGTSAGAMNAVMLAEGWRRGGRDGAKQALASFWLSVASSDFSIRLPEHVEGAVARFWLHAMRYLSPYDVNLLDINPLEDLLIQQVDFEKLRQDSAFKLFIAATEVSTGKLKLFNEREIALPHLLASACLPNIHKAIEIEGAYYWDGGFSGNPAVFPLIYECIADDVLVVLLQSLQRDSLPVSAESITERVTELGFQSTFMREMRAVSNIRQYSSDSRWRQGWAERKVNGLRCHLLQSDASLEGLGQLSKYDNSKQFLISLMESGREACDHWLYTHQAKLGKRESCDLDALFS
ncbi:patatin-like phospholipase family protein [Amphritea sp. 1_MG-2023]|uniref:patatin-like phospholipase family protein n=1 Tax=Amphritea sp. 1_MG-2023 TaxID=3062670 RepID=UPI0026E13827|nr:patatin-like phospholipase family protein [Amphritea sp. 1_MG-2023]MDO6564843.1 patatin-like phospholipase family protein [Amphritea sp. 1_MG-2023]